MINFGPKDLVILGNLIMKIYKTRPKVHKVRVQRMKSRISVLEEQLQMAKDVVSDSVHVQQTVCRLEQVLEDALNLMMKMEDLSWIERFIKNSSVDGNFADLNQRLSQESLSLVLSLNINTQVVQQTFSEDRRKAEDEKDRAADMKFLEEMKESEFDAHTVHTYCKYRQIHIYIQYIHTIMHAVYTHIHTHIL